MKTGEYTSSLMFGVQWDLIMKYLETKGTTQDDLRKDSTSWGNYKNNLWEITNKNSKYASNGIEWISDARGKKDTNTSILLSIGASEKYTKD